MGSLGENNITVLSNCVDSFKVEVEKCIFTINSLQKHIKVTLYPAKEIEMELDFTLLISKYLKLLLKIILGKANNTDRKLNKFERAFDNLNGRYKQCPYFSISQKKLYLKNLSFSLKAIKLNSGKLGYTYLRFLNYYIMKLNDKVFYCIFNKNSVKSYDIISLSFTNNVVKSVSQSFYLYMLNSSEEFLFNQHSYSPRWKTIKNNTEIIMHTSFPSGKMFKRVFFYFSNLIYSLYNKIEINTFRLGFNSISNLCINSLNLALRPSLSKKLKKLYAVNQKLEIISWYIIIYYVSVFDSFELKFLNFFYNLSLPKILYNEEFFININDMNDNRLYSKLVAEINMIKLRVISNMNFKKNSKLTKLNQYLSFLNLEIKLTENISLPSYDVIINVHGGGFFAQTSKSHLNYLINFSKDSNSVVISIDYTVATKNKYPNLFFENMKAYEKIITNFEEMFNFRIKKLILLGDSGGAHICLAIMKYAITNNIRIPDHLFLLYPSSRILFDTMTPSLLMSCKDSFIEHTIIDHIQKSVLDLDKNVIEHYENDDNLNFYLSDQKIVSQFPNTSIIVGSDDPLKDESYRLADFLIQNKVQIQIREFIYHPHGFMNLSGIVPHFKKTEKFCIKMINEIFEI